MKYKSAGAPRILQVQGRRLGPRSTWVGWIERAQGLGCNGLWLADYLPDFVVAQRLEAGERGKKNGATKHEREFEEFSAAARAAGLKLVTDFSPAFMSRASPLLRVHPDWFVSGPDGTPAVPSGLASSELAASLVECNFSGPEHDELLRLWNSVVEQLIARGFEAIVCRAAHRLTPNLWKTLLAPVRGKAECWAETFGATIDASEKLAPVGFDAFFSSAPWWDYHADWFLEQEARLRRLAPTIAFADSPLMQEDSTLSRVDFSYGFAASIAWGVVVAVPRTGENVAAINAMKRVLPALNAPTRLRRLSAPGARAVALVVQPLDAGLKPLLMVFNPDAENTVEVVCGPLFTALDACKAEAQERTPGRSPALLHAGSRLALEPLGMRWFELPAQKRGAPRRSLKAPARAHDPVAIDNVTPHVDAGKYAVKRVLGETVTVGADVVVEGHCRPAAALRYRMAGETTWHETAFSFFDNDRWHGEFTPDRIGCWEFQLIAWRDRYRAWREEAIRRRDAGQSLGAELGEAEAMLAQATAAAEQAERARLEEIGTLLHRHGEDEAARAQLLLAQTTLKHIEAALPRGDLSLSSVHGVLIERARARTGAWYECFPRSLAAPGQHGTFDDLINHLPYIAGLGFDVLYLPPIHPIGEAYRKGKNNALECGPQDPGSPWAIGAKSGGHSAIHPALGTLADFRRVLAAARGEGLEVAMDFAIQCSRDHPWLREHPEWFRWRPDGSIRYAENPPKKYQDIVNVDFYCEEREALWKALAAIVLFWCAEGVRIFRVDNPHTKPLPFWQWLLSAVRASYPDTIFLAEAFTRPKLMYQFAKLGFSQSYSYFIWRETKAELTAYMQELTQDPVAQFFRPNFWVNTPDINPFYLHDGERASFVIRAVLAATLAPSWGMYSGYELCEHQALLNEDGSAREEYLDSEKYELKSRDVNASDARGNIGAEIAMLNRIRHDHPALSELVNLRFHVAHNDQVMFYSKQTADDLLWIIVSLDARAPQEADIELPLDMLGADEQTLVEAKDLFFGATWQWQGRHQHVGLSPERPALILHLHAGAKQ